MFGLYDKALNKKDFAAAADRVRDPANQHHPGAPDGIEGFGAFRGSYEREAPELPSEIKRPLPKATM